jgi:hypothetical protein
MVETPGQVRRASTKGSQVSNLAASSVAFAKRAVQNRKAGRRQRAISNLSGLAFTDRCAAE